MKHSICKQSACAFLIVTTLVGCSGGGGSGETNTPTPVAPVPPAIGASPTSLSFAATQGGANPATQTVSVSNTGGGTWTASDNAAWLSLSPASGIGNGTMTLTVTTGTLTAGSYSGAVTMSATGATPVTVSVTFTVHDPVFFDVPSDRRITWSAGLDSVGGIPNYANVTCTGLDPTGVNDNTSPINACIANASPGTAVYIPAGVYRINDTINMTSNVVLRGKKASVGPWLPAEDLTATTLVLFDLDPLDENAKKGRILFNGGTRSTAWPQGRDSGTAIIDGYKQGSTSLTVSDAANYAVNDVISIYQNRDPDVIDDRGNTYLGEGCDDIKCADSHVFAQYAVITAKNSNTLTIQPPIYYVTLNPNHLELGQSIRKQTFKVVKAGLEDLRIEGTGTISQPIALEFTQNCWIKGIDSYNNGGTIGDAPHVWTMFSFQNEYRDNYLHSGGSHDSGKNYGFQQYNWNSQHKIENNIIRDTRHAITFEGGGSGNAILYNYMDDNWESEIELPTTRNSRFLSEDAVANHGAHPYMNLWEGNFSADFWGDYTQGSSSHNTAFRNYFQCKNTNLELSTSIEPSTSIFSWVCIEIEKYNRYYNLVGNVIGYPALTGGTLLCNSNPTSCYGDPPEIGRLPVIYRFGFDGTVGSYSDSEAFRTAIIHGNFDYVTGKVADWQKGVPHTLPNSLYYDSKPAFFGSLAWPPFGSDLSPMVGVLPAKDRYDKGL